MHCRRLSLADRATMVPLLAAVVDFDSSQATYEQYDSMTAKELFQKYSVYSLSHPCGEEKVLHLRMGTEVDTPICQPIVLLGCAVDKYARQLRHHERVHHLRVDSGSAGRCMRSF